MSQLEEQDPFQFLGEVDFDVPSIPEPDLEDIPAEEPVDVQPQESFEVEEPAAKNEEDSFRFLEDIQFTEPGEVTVQGPRSYTVENSPVRVEPSSLMDLSDDEAKERLPAKIGLQPTKDEIESLHPALNTPEYYTARQEMATAYNKATSNDERAAILMEFTDVWMPAALERATGDSGWMEKGLNSLATAATWFDNVTGRPARALIRQLSKNRMRELSGEGYFQNPAETFEDFKEAYKEADGSFEEGEDTLKKLYFLLRSGGGVPGAKLLVDQIAGVGDEKGGDRIAQYQAEADAIFDVGAEMFSDIGYTAAGAMAQIIPGGSNWAQYMAARKEAKEQGSVGGHQFIGLIGQILVDPLMVVKAPKIASLGGVNNTSTAAKVIDDTIAAETRAAVDKDVAAGFVRAEDAEKSFAQRIDVARNYYGREQLDAANIVNQYDIPNYYGFEAPRLLSTLKDPRFSNIVDDILAQAKVDLPSAAQVNIKTASLSDEAAALADEMGLADEVAGEVDVMATYRAEAAWAEIIKESIRRKEVPKEIIVDYKGVDVSTGKNVWDSKVRFEAPKRVGKQTAEQAFEKQKMLHWMDNRRTKMMLGLIRRYPQLEPIRRTMESIVMLEKAQPLAKPLPVGDEAAAELKALDDGIRAGTIDAANPAIQQRKEFLQNQGGQRARRKYMPLAPKGMARHGVLHQGVMRLGEEFEMMRHRRATLGAQEAAAFAEKVKAIGATQDTLRLAIHFAELGRFEPVTAEVIEKIARLDKIDQDLANAALGDFGSLPDVLRGEMEAIAKETGVFEALSSAIDDAEEMYKANRVSREEAMNVVRSNMGVMRFMMRQQLGDIFAREAELAAIKDMSVVRDQIRELRTWKSKFEDLIKTKLWTSDQTFDEAINQLFEFQKTQDEALGPFKVEDSAGPLDLVFEGYRKKKILPKGEMEDWEGVRQSVQEGAEAALGKEMGDVFMEFNEMRARTWAAWNKLPADHSAAWYAKTYSSVFPINVGVSVEAMEGLSGRVLFSHRESGKVVSLAKAARESQSKKAQELEKTIESSNNRFALLANEHAKLASDIEALDKRIDLARKSGSEATIRKYENQRATLSQKESRVVEEAQSLFEKNKAAVNELKEVLSKDYDSLDAPGVGLSREGLPDSVMDQAVAGAPATPEFGFQGVTKDDLRGLLDGGTSATDVATFIAKNAESPAYQSIAWRLSKSPELKGVDVRALSSGDSLEGVSSKGAAHLMRGALGVNVNLYDKGVYQVLVRGDGLSSSGLNAETLLHELVHAATTRKYEAALHVSRDPATGGRVQANLQTPAGVAARQITELFNDIVRHRRLARRRGEDVPAFDREMSSATEFIAYGMTNKPFQEYLKSLPLDSGGLDPLSRAGRRLGRERLKAAWDLFVEHVANLLGIEARDKNALAALIESTDDLVQSSLDDLVTRPDLPSYQAMDDVDRLFSRREEGMAPLAYTQFLRDRKAVIGVFENVKGPEAFTAMMEEFGHILRRDLPAQDLKVSEDWVRSQLGSSAITVTKEGRANRWTEAAEELWARAFVKWVKTGELPEGFKKTNELRAAFQKAKDWLINIYYVITGKSAPEKIGPDGSAIPTSQRRRKGPQVRAVFEDAPPSIDEAVSPGTPRVKITKDIEEVFSRMLDPQTAMGKETPLAREVDEALVAVRNSSDLARAMSFLQLQASMRRLGLAAGRGQEEIDSLTSALISRDPDISTRAEVDLDTVKRQAVGANRVAGDVQDIPKPSGVTSMDMLKRRVRDDLVKRVGLSTDEVDEILSKHFKGALKSIDEESALDKAADLAEGAAKPEAIVPLGINEDAPWRNPVNAAEGPESKNLIEDFTGEITVNVYEDHPLYKRSFRVDMEESFLPGTEEVVFQGYPVGYYLSEVKPGTKEILEDGETLAMYIPPGGGRDLYSWEDVMRIKQGKLVGDELDIADDVVDVAEDSSEALREYERLFEPPEGLGVADPQNMEQVKAKIESELYEFEGMDYKPARDNVMEFVERLIGYLKDREIEIDANKRDVEFLGYDYDLAVDGLGQSIGGSAEQLSLMALSNLVKDIADVAHLVKGEKAIEGFPVPPRPTEAEVPRVDSIRSTDDIIPALEYTLSKKEGMSKNSARRKVFGEDNENVKAYVDAVQSKRKITFDKDLERLRQKFAKQYKESSEFAKTQKWSASESVPEYATAQAFEKIKDELVSLLHMEEAKDLVVPAQNRKLQGMSVEAIAKDFTKPQLQEMMKFRGVTGSSRMSKAQMAAHLKEASSPRRVALKKKVNPVQNYVDNYDSLITKMSAEYARLHPSLARAEVRLEDVRSFTSEQAAEAVRNYDAVSANVIPAIRDRIYRNGPKIEGELRNSFRESSRRLLRTSLPTREVDSAMEDLRIAVARSGLGSRKDEAKAALKRFEAAIDRAKEDISSVRNSTVQDAADIAAMKSVGVSEANEIKAKAAIKWLNQQINDREVYVRMELASARKAARRMKETVDGEEVLTPLGEALDIDVAAIRNQSDLEEAMSRLQAPQGILTLRNVFKDVSADPAIAAKQLSEKMTEVVKGLPETEAAIYDAAKQLNYDLRAPGELWDIILNAKKWARSYGDALELRRDTALRAYREDEMFRVFDGMDKPTRSKIERLLKNRSLYGVSKDAPPRIKALAKSLGMSGSEELFFQVRGKGRARVGDTYTNEQIEQALKVAKMLDDVMDNQLKKMQQAGLFKITDKSKLADISFYRTQLKVETDPVKRKELVQKIQLLKKTSTRNWTKDEFLSRVQLGAYVPHLKTSAARLKTTAMLRGGMPSSVESFFEKNRTRASTIDDLNDQKRNVIATQDLYHNAVTGKGPAWSSPGAPFAGKDPQELYEAANTGRLEEVFTPDEWMEAVKFQRERGTGGELFDFFETDFNIIVERYMRESNTRYAEAMFNRDMQELFPVGKEIGEITAGDSAGFAELRAREFGYSRQTKVDSIEAATGIPMPSQLRAHEEQIMQMLMQGDSAQSVTDWLREKGINVDKTHIEAFELPYTFAPTPIVEYLRWMNKPDWAHGKWWMGWFDGIHSVAKGMATISSIAHVGMNASGNHVSIAQKLGTGIFNPANHLDAMAITMKLSPEDLSKFSKNMGIAHEDAIVTIGPYAKSVGEWRKAFDEAGISESPLSRMFLEEMGAHGDVGLKAATHQLAGSMFGATLGAGAGFMIGGPVGAAAAGFLGQYPGALLGEIVSKAAASGRSGVDAVNQGWKRVWFDEMETFRKSIELGTQAGVKQAVRYFGERSVGLTAGAAIGSVFGAPGAVAGAIAGMTLPSYMRMMTGLNQTIETQARITLAVGELRKGKSLSEAAKSVDDALRNYSHLTPVEKHVLRRMFFFYTWDAGNMRFQTHQMIKNPRQAAVFTNFVNGVFKGQFTEEEIQSMPANLRWSILMRTGPGMIWKVNGLPQQAYIEMLGRWSEGKPSGMLTRMRPDALLMFEWFADKQSVYYGKGWDELTNIRSLKDASPFLKWLAGFPVKKDPKTGKWVESPSLRPIIKDGKVTGYKKDYRAMHPERYYLMSKLPGWRILMEQLKLQQDTFTSRALDEGAQNAEATALQRSMAFMLGIKPYSVDFEAQQQYQVWKFIEELQRQIKLQDKNSFVSIQRAVKRIPVEGGGLKIPLDAPALINPPGEREAVELLPIEGQ